MICAICSSLALAVAVVEMNEQPHGKMTMPAVPKPVQRHLQPIPHKN